MDNVILYTKNGTSNSIQYLRQHIESRLSAEKKYIKVYISST